MSLTRHGPDGHDPERSPSGGQPQGARRLALLVLWFALAGAFLELGVRGIQKFVLGNVLWVSRDVIWMAPLGQLFFLVPAGALLLLAGAIRRRRVTLRTAITVLAFVVACGLFLTPRFMHVVAGIVLAAGLAWRAGLFAAARPAAFGRLLAATAPALALALAMPALAARAGSALDERATLASLPAAPSGATNVILLIWDTVRASSLSLYGHARATTPNLERLARGGVVFDRAIATAPWTLPSHASIFTGLLRHEINAGWTQPLGDEVVTLAEVFRDAGYVTGGFAANVLYADWEHGLSQGFSRYDDYDIGPGQVLLSTSLGRRIVKGRHGWEQGAVPRVLAYDQFVGRRLAEDVDEAFLDWLDGRGERPFFAFLNYFDAHLPYVPPAPFDTLFGPERPETRFGQRLIDALGGDDLWEGITTRELQAELAAYEASIAYLDHRLAVLHGELARRGLLESTVIVLTSDHGEEFFEHGDYEHGTNLYLPQLHVPLVVLQPGRVPGGFRVVAPVSLRDIAATVAGLTGVPGGRVFPGRSLERFWSGPLAADETALLEPVVSGLIPGLQPDVRMRSLIAGGIHYIRNTDGSAELYEYVSDPAESRDLADEAARAEAVERWDETLDAILECETVACCCGLSAALRQEAAGAMRRIPRVRAGG